VAALTLPSLARRLGLSTDAAGRPGGRTD
jgi:hypothetical protein